jgi:hypothetical protein
MSLLLLLLLAFSLKALAAIFAAAVLAATRDAIDDETASSICAVMQAEGGLTTAGAESLISSVDFFLLLTGFLEGFSLSFVNIVPSPPLHSRHLLFRARQLLQILFSPLAQMMHFLVQFALTT